uniref:Uncharacterized protein n=1 Tax=Arundo donax TaxID=35708 RepID=A0A0A9HPB0_ARUDO
MPNCSQISFPACKNWSPLRVTEQPHDVTMTSLSYAYCSSFV